MAQALLQAMGKVGLECSANKLIITRQEASFAALVQLFLQTDYTEK
jgi:hypothetical protein